VRACHLDAQQQVTITHFDILCQLLHGGNDLLLISLYVWQQRHMRLKQWSIKLFRLCCYLLL
jgi:hypothetical protein